jgi:hypothetical protein
MATKGSKLESTLVSMAGTLIYLRGLAATLSAKPIVPQAVTSHMPHTGNEVAALKLQFESAQRAAHQEAQPFVDEWLRLVGLQVGGVIRGTMGHRISSRTDVLTFEGGIADARLHHSPVNGVRVMSFTLDGARISLSDGSSGALLSELTESLNRGHFNTTAMRETVDEDAEAGTKVRKLHVHVPVQARMREDWVRCHTLQLT